jgi:hypothetical protein
MADKRYLRAGYVWAVAAAALAAACTTNGRLESSRGIALRIDDDIDALEAATDRADAHCDDHDRHAVLQGVSRVDGNELLATFDCAGWPGFSSRRSAGAVSVRRPALHHGAPAPLNPPRNQPLIQAKSCLATIASRFPLRQTQSDAAQGCRTELPPSRIRSISEAASSWAAPSASSDAALR